MDEMNLDNFGEIMDDFLKENHIQMLIDMPEGTIDPVVKDNAGIGAVVKFYIILNSLIPVCEEMKKDIGIPDGYTKEWEKMLDDILDLVKRDLLEV